MATRHNTNVNPALANDNAGWGGGSVPARTAVTGFGRPFAARYTSGTFSSSSRGAVVAGQTYTMSEYVHFDIAAAAINGTLYIEWRNAGGSVVTYDNTPYSAPARTVTRISITAVAPANAAFAQLITDNFNFGTGPTDFTQVLIEPGAALGDYFDGDSPGASWDGTPGSSASTLPDDGVAGVMAVTLPALTADIAGTVAVEAELAVTFPALRVFLAGTSDVVPILPGTMSPRDRAGTTATARPRDAVRMEGRSR